MVTLACAAPADTVALAEDCDDLSAAVNPAAAEVCNLGDDDCDGLTDDADADVLPGEPTYRDADGDGHGDPAVRFTSCTVPSGAVASFDDCDDGDSSSYPGATEVCDPLGADEDCDGVANDGDSSLDLSTRSTWYADLDQDGYGSAGSSAEACDQPTGYSATDTDCNDTNAGVSPGAIEVCDNSDIDEDCDGLTDDSDPNVDSATLSMWYLDDDGDGWGHNTNIEAACDQPVDRVALGGDCDDRDVAYNPDAPEDDCADPNDYNCDGSTGFADHDGDGFAACEECDDRTFANNPDADERCDGVDNDCDSDIDEPDAVDATTWYTDADEDGYGDAETGEIACDAPAGTVDDDTDCDDTVATTNPGVLEVCDSVDNDCDGSADDDASDATVYYADLDADGFGDPALSRASCEAPPDGVTNRADCDDSDAVRNPDATEVCGGGDEDCDGLSDDEDPTVDGATQDMWYRDADEDGFGDAGFSRLSCAAPDAASLDNTDCDDTRAAVNPGEDEVCDLDDLDEDCSGLADDADEGVNPSGFTTWYADRDGDDYGDAEDSLAACDAPAEYVADNADCDDGLDNVNPGAIEVCDSADTDEDCDGDADDNDNSVAIASLLTFYRDGDGDGFGDPNLSRQICDAPEGASLDNTDCDDENAAANPEGDEVCDSANADEDCDGLSDDLDSSVDTSGMFLLFVDDDGDGFGGEGSGYGCDAGDGLSLDGGDCDETNAAVNPGAPEVCDSADLDDDCDGAVDEADSSIVGATWYLDTDSDGYGGDTSIISCETPEGYIGTGGDCDDTNTAVNPGAAERCDSADTDEDCDGLADDADTAALDTSTRYRDADTDGYGNPSDSLASCDPVAGYVVSSGDCNDGAANVNPGATEQCDPGNLDEDCDGLADDADTSTSGQSTWYLDTDGDSFGTTAGSLVLCDRPSGYALTSTDCDDSSPRINPNGTEVCDSADTDEDCDGLADNDDSSADSTGQRTWYRDVDLDGYGVSGTTTTTCDAPLGYAALDTDCDDAIGDINPGAIEVCDTNNVDENCNGDADDDDSTTLASTRLTWYYDADGDQFGTTGATTAACDQPSAYAPVADDCDDTLANINPDADEVCDSAALDEDCDGLSDDDDDSTTGQPSWFRDDDEDGYGNAETVACAQPSGTATAGGDCDDESAAINPGATETCDSFDLDEDCDGLSDDDDTEASGQSTYYLDLDEDGYGDPDDEGSLRCDVGGGYATEATDCDDLASAVNPGATEVCGDGLDNDCVADTTCRDLSGLGALTSADLTYIGVTTGASASITGALGGTAAGGGDVDGDGYPDLLLGDRLFDGSTSNVGRSYLLRGGTGGLPTALASATATFQVSAGTSGGDRSGQGLGLVTDQDNDGDDEVVIGAYASNYAATDSGEVRLFLGGSLSGALTTANAAVTIAGPAVTSSFTGWQVANLGDLDADGLAEWAVSSAGSTTSASVIAGGTISGTYTVGSGSFYAELGAAGAGAGIAEELDLTGDGVADLVTVGFGSTSVLVFEGGAVSGTLNVASANATISGLTLTAFGTGTSFYQHPIASAGDNDGDGYDDLVVGEDGFDTPSTDAGRALLFHGPIAGSWTSGDASASINGVFTTDAAGRSVGGGGDIDGDGFDDWLVGAPGFDLGGAATANYGAAALIYGPTSGSLTVASAGATWYGGIGSALGSATEMLGDVDADGYDDVLLGAPAGLNSSGFATGNSYIFYGNGE